MRHLLLTLSLLLLFSLSVSGEESEQIFTLTVIASAYSYESGLYGCHDNLLHYGIISTDPAVIPIGSKIYIEGLGYFEAGDTGIAIKGNKIDIFFEDRQMALNFGVKKLKIKVWKHTKN